VLAQINDLHCFCRQGPRDHVLLSTGLLLSQPPQLCMVLHLCCMKHLTKQLAASRQQQRKLMRMSLRQCRCWQEE